MLMDFTADGHGNISNQTRTVTGVSAVMLTGGCLTGSRPFTSGRCSAPTSDAGDSADRPGHSAGAVFLVGLSARAGLMT